MRLDRILSDRWRGLTQEVAKFGTIGVINLIVNFAVFNLLWLTVLRSGEVKAKAVATIVATTCAYFMNRHWTYRDRPRSTLRREYSLFFFFNIVGLLIEVAVVGLTKYGFGLTHIVVLNIAGGLGICLGTIFRFWAYRTHVFRREEPAVAEPASVAVVAALTPVAVAPLPIRDHRRESADQPSPVEDTTELAGQRPPPRLDPQLRFADELRIDDTHFEDETGLGDDLGLDDDLDLNDELTRIELADIVANADPPVRN